MLVMAATRRLGISICSGALGQLGQGVVMVRLGFASDDWMGRSPGRGGAPGVSWERSQASQTPTEVR